MNAQKNQLTEEQRTDAEIVADIIGGVPVDAKAFFKVSMSLILMAFNMGVKAESGRQRLAAGPGM